MRRFIAFVWKGALGAVLCLTPLTAILVVGWTARAMQRSVLKHWYARSNGGEGHPSFAAFARQAYATRRLAHWPNWFVAEDLGQRMKDSRDAGAGIFRRMFVLLVSLFAALWANVRAGVQVVLATWVVTLPLMILWLLSWWGGWENSFNKGYEQAWVGPIIGVAATLLFVAVMTYVPMAQARLAVSGRWRGFFDYRLIRSLVAGHPFALLKLAVYFVLAGIVVALLRSAPLAAGNYLDGLVEWTDQRVMALRAGYYGLCAVVSFALFVWLRLAAARVYAHAVLADVRGGRLKVDRLSDNETEYLRALRLLEPEAREKSGIVVRAAASTGRGVLRLLTAAPALILWLVFAALIYIAQFFNHDWLAWINQPVVQIPWMSLTGVLTTG